MKNGYDIIGDVHGNAPALSRLLGRLGYRTNGGGFQHRDGRRVIFLGDYLDRGPEIPATLEIVRAMVEAGNAFAILGNHEINALRFHATGSDGQPLRPHTDTNLAQHQATLDQFSGRRDLAEWLDWLSRLPLALEIDGLRVVHACWDGQALAELSAIPRWSGEVLERYSRKGTAAYETISRVVNGPEAILPEGYTHRAADGKERCELRVKWWLRGGALTCRQWGFPDSPRLPDLPPRSVPETGYPSPGIPTFFGHYALKKSRPVLQRADLACLDYGAAKGGHLAAYRWDGERALNEDRILMEVTP